MVRKIITHIWYPALIAGIVLALFGVAYAATNIDSTNKWAWGTNVGWFNFNPTHGGGVTVYSDHLEGYAWAENIGWIHFQGTAQDSTPYQVNNDGAGNLSGYAWSTSAGWINFNPTHGGVTINTSTGSFDGYAWGENVGWISFSGIAQDNTVYKVVTSYIPPVPEMDVQRPAGTSIADGGTDPQGTKKAGEQVTLTYTVENTGSATLNVTNITSASPSNVSVGSISPTSFTVASGGGTATFDVPYTPTADGAFSFELDITNDDSDEANYDITVSGTGDGNAPTLDSFTRKTPATSPTNADTLVFLATFDEDVQNVDAADFAINGTTTATVSNVNGTSASTYEVTVSGGDLAGFNGTVGLDLAGAQDITDLVGNALPAGEPTTDETYLVDNDGPTVTIEQDGGQADPTNGATINFQVIFSESVTGFAAADVTLGGTANPGTKTVTGSGTTYNVAVGGMTGDGTVTATVNADAAQDAAGNNSAASTSTDNMVTYDTTAPTPAIDQATGQTDPTSNQPVNFEVDFGESVTGFTASDLTLGGTAPGTKSAVVTGGPSSYNVAVSGLTGDGTVTVSVGAGAAQDSAGNTSDASTATDNQVTFIAADLVITKSVTPATPVNPGDPITYTITFSNIGQALATGVVITDVVPVSVTNTSVISSGVAITQVGGTRYVWDVADLAVGQGGVITITGQLSATLTTSTFTNTSVITTTVVDANPGNNSSDAGVTVIADGTIVIVKDAIPDDPQDFDFTGDLGDFTLDDALPDDTDGISDTITFPNLFPATYNVTETVPFGWEVTTIICDDGSPTQVPTGTASIDLAPGEVVTCTFTNEALDSDGDGVPDGVEGTGDRDGDGIPDNEDYDPTGYFYDETTGQIIPGGQIAVTGPGVITIIQDGSNGYYQFTTDGTAGIYTIQVTLPPRHVWSSTCLRQDPPPFDPTGGPNPTVLGNGEDGDTGFLTSNACTDYYLSFDLEAQDPFIFNNNFPLSYVPPVPVGGYIVPVNKLGLLAPWMGLVSLAGLAGVGVGLVRRRRSAWT